MLVDSHAHLEVIDDLGNVLKRARADGVGKIITIGTSLASSKKAVELAQEYSSSDLTIYATCGIHPQDGRSEVEKLSLYQCINTLKQLAKSSDKIIAIGECGLDYRLSTDPSTHSTSSVQASSGQAKQLTTDPTSSRKAGLRGASKDKKFQRELFVKQIELARELDLPLIVHCRNAWAEVLDLLKQGLPLSGLQGETLLKGVFHSWTGNWEAAQKALGLGFYISFSGIVTFKNAPEVQEVAKKAPLDRILLETDSPFLTPSPLRGELNEPKNVRIVGKFLAGLRSQPLDKISSVTTANARRLFQF